MVYAESGFQKNVKYFHDDSENFCGKVLGALQ